MGLRHAARVTCFSLLAASCGGEPEGVQLGGPNCTEESTVLAGLDAASDVGFTAADVLAAVSGTHKVPMRWSGPVEDGSTMLVFGPESGDGELTVTIGYEGGEIRYVDSRPIGDPPPEFAFGCHDRLEITVNASVHTEGGALAETIVAPLHATTRHVAVLAAEIPFAELQGTLAPTVLEPPNAEVDPLDLTIGIGPAGLFGSASTIMAVKVGGGVAASFVDVARWPIASRCEPLEAPIGLDDAIADFSAADALAAVAGAADLSLSWQNFPAAAMTFTLAPHDTPVCAGLGGDSFGKLRVFADAMIQTDDGRWNGSFSVEVVATAAADGSLGQIEVAIPQFIDHAVAAADFEATYGLMDVDFGGHETVALQFNGYYAVSDNDVSVNGEFSVQGFEQNPCPDPSSGCAGTDLVTLAKGTWGTP